MARCFCEQLSSLAQLKVVPTRTTSVLMIEHCATAWRPSPLLTPMNSQESSWQFVSCTFPHILELLVSSSFTALLVPQAGGTKPMWDEGWSEVSFCICVHSFLHLDFQLCHLRYKHGACWLSLAGPLLWHHYTTLVPLCGWASGGHQLSWKVFCDEQLFGSKFIMGFHLFSSVQSLSRVWLCNLMDCSTPGLPVHHQLLELAQTHVHWVGDAIQPSHPLSSPSPPAFNLSQHQGLSFFFFSFFLLVWG